MKIEVDTSQKFSAYDQFDPFTLKTVQFFDVGCLGGAVKVDSSDGESSYFTCTACGASAYEPGVMCRAAVRRLLILGEPQKVRGIEFVVRGKSSTSSSAT